MKIVVVAENGFIRSSLNVNLRSSGYEVVEAEPACLLEVLRAMREALAHLVILDFDIPRCNGETTVRIIREDPILTMTPILVIHQADDREAVERMGRWELMHFLKKPLKVETMLQAVRDLYPSFSIDS